MAEIVISGISCRLPESDNMEEFWDNLINGIDMVTETDKRWPPGLHGLPKRMGTIKDISRFDASFFGIPPKQAHLMDPQIRMLIECTHEAFVDAGFRPTEVRGSRTGCFMCSTMQDAHDLLSANPEEITGYEMTGCNRTMLSNRVSYTFDLKGPSLTLDTACSSGLEALCNAVSAIRGGRCDAAVVGASSLHLKPENSLQFHKLTMLSPDGACKSFDASGNGYVRSEGIVVLYLQRVEDARRAYVTVAEVLDNCDGYKEQGITFPSGEVQKMLLKAVYEKAGIPPATVGYFEAHGTGTAAGDPQEVNSIAECMCKGRERPLLLGSVKSNMGHGEAVAGLAAVAKVILSMNHKTLPRNLHYHNPNLGIPALRDGRLKVVDENTPWDGGTVGINSFGFGGANVHAILKPCSTAANKQIDRSLRLVTVASRSQEKLKSVLEVVKTNSDDLALHRMLAGMNGSGKHLNSRGFAIVNAETFMSDIRECKEAGPVWFVFPGMGQQWPKMGRQMLRLPVFRSSLEICHQTLVKEGFDLLDMIETGEDDVYASPLNAFVAITSIQVSLVDVLRVVGIEPQGMIGHSVGELGCAYADGTLTAEQTVLAAYWRGRCIVEGNLPEGAMAAVGLTWEEAKKRCPEGVVPACHNAAQSVTISGPKDALSNFVSELNDQGVFAREVNSSGIAFHSYFMKQCAPQLNESLRKVIPNAKERTKRWLTTSIPKTEWDSDLAKTSSAAYHVNNLVSPVLFHEAVQQVPENAIVIEIGSHGLFQGILKRALKPSNFVTSLMKKDEADNRLFLLKNIGQCHLRGLEVYPENLYEPVQYPVSVQTPMVSQLVGWDHETAWKVPQPRLPGGVAVRSKEGSGENGGRLVQIEMNDTNYIRDHVLNGKILFPAMGYLHLAWETLAKSLGSTVDMTSVVFTDVHVHNASVLHMNGVVLFQVSVSNSTGRFEVSEKGELAADGFVKVLEATSMSSEIDGGDQTHEEFGLSADDFYKELRIRGYEYGPDFRSVQAAMMKGENGLVRWRGNWVTYLDAMLQAYILTQNDRAMRLPTRIKRLEIRPQYVIGEEQDHLFEVDSDTNTIRAAGVMLRGAHFTTATRHLPHRPPLLERFLFTPYEENPRAIDLEYRVYAKACIDASRGKKLGKPHVPGIASQESLFLKSSLRSNEIFEQGSLHHEKRGLVPIEQNGVKNEGLMSLGTILSRRQEGKYYLLDSILKRQAGEIQPKGKDKKTDAVWREDRVLGGSLYKHDLKAAIDIYIENTLNYRIKLLILCSSPIFFYEYTAKIQKITQQFPHVQFTISCSTPRPETSEKDSFKQMRVNVVDWCFGNGRTPEFITSANIILACNFLTDGTDGRIQELREICKRLGPAAHLFVHEWSHAPDLYSYIHDATNNNNNNSNDDRHREQHSGLSVQPRTLLNQEGLSIILEKNDGVLATFFSCRRKNNKPGPVEHVLCNDLMFTWLTDIKDRYEKIKEEPTGRLWLISDFSWASGLMGFIACLLQEPIGEKVRCIFNGDLSGRPIPREYLPGGSEWDTLVQRDLVMNVFNEGKLGCYRRFIIEQKYTEKRSDCAIVDCMSRGDLTSLRWVGVPYPSPSVRLQNEVIHVTYVSMNFRDLMLASGRLSSDAIPDNIDASSVTLGLEFTGVNAFGERRMGIVPTGGMATEVSVAPQYLWPVPSAWSLADAATVPIAYVTAFYALVTRGQIQRGESVLIHSGTSAVGQAAIRVAHSRGCVVYSTVGTPEKVKFLMEEFRLPAERIGHSRSTSFADDILKHTKGKGVDLVLNSLSEEKLQSSLDMLAVNGRFMEIGKFDLSNNSKLGMAVFLKNVAFHGILVENLIDRTSTDWLTVWKLVQNGINSGIVKPLKTHVFPSDQLEKAFRFMGDGKHIGKVLIKVRSENRLTAQSVKKTMKRIKIPEANVRASARTYFPADKVYIITGGLGGLGLEVANWLVHRGARNLVLTSRSGVKTGYQRRLISIWQEKGVKVLVTNRDVSYQRETRQLFGEAQRMGPVGGIFHLAAVLHDTHFATMTMDKWKPVTEIKVSGLINLDKITRSDCAGTLDHFVAFSSASSGYGNAGQTNYGYANSFMERLCEKRHHDGLPGKAIQWGFIGDVGIVQDHLGGNEHYHSGIVPQRIESFLKTIDLLLQMPEPVVSSVVPADKTLLEMDGESQGDIDHEEELANTILNILGVQEVTEENFSTQLGDFGLDSLMTTEIRQTLGRRFNLQLSVAEIQNLSINDLKEML